MASDTVIALKSQSGFVRSRPHVGQCSIPVTWFLEAAFWDTWGKGQGSEQQELTGLQWLEYIFVLKKYIIHRFNVALLNPKRALSVFKGERSCNFLKSLSSKICWQRVLFSIGLSALGTEIFPIVLHFNCPRTVFSLWRWQRGFTGCPVPHEEITM